MSNKTQTVPGSVFSAMGPIPVVLQSGLDGGDSLGEFSGSSRVIKLERNASPEARLQTLFHEMTHLALWDGGVTEVLPPKIEEAVCSALGTYFASAVQAGYLKLTGRT